METLYKDDADPKEHFTWVKEDNVKKTIMTNVTTMKTKIQILMIAALDNLDQL